MSKPGAMAVAETMVEYAEQDPPISYADYDCYKIIRKALRDNGGDMRYSGSNDVYRNGCEWVMPLDEAVEQDMLLSGMALFIVEPESDSTPAKYRGDGKGDASHMGMYTGLREIESGKLTEVVHSSASRGGVYPSTLRNGWTHAGKLKDVDYSEWTETGGNPATEAPGSNPAPDTGPQYATVDVPAGEHLRMRETPAPNGKYMLKIPRGEPLTITAHMSGYGQTSYRGYTGWVDERYLRYIEGGKAEAAQGYVVNITDLRGEPLTVEQAVNLLDEYRGAGYGGEVVRGVQ